MDADDQHHAACLDLLAAYPGPLIVPTLVITEVVYFIGSRLGTEAEMRFLGDLAGGTLIAEPAQPADWLRIAELIWAYRDFPLGTVDASVIATAERLGITSLATLDRRHFSAVRPAHVAAFELLPA
ncbi:MAG: PIN domain-containing protein [Chloroflexota bacterium]|nr:PIN domain-containing protein [Chloroflexota bacterium]